MCVCVCVCVCVHARACMHAWMFVNARVCVCTYVRVHVCNLKMVKCVWGRCVALLHAFDVALGSPLVGISISRLAGKQAPGHGRGQAGKWKV